MEKVDSERYTLAMFTLGWARGLLGRVHCHLQLLEYEAETAMEVARELAWLDARIEKIMTLNDEAADEE